MNEQTDLAEQFRQHEPPARLGSDVRQEARRPPKSVPRRGRSLLSARALGVDAATCRNWTVMAASQWAQQGEPHADKVASSCP